MPEHRMISRRCSLCGSDEKVTLYEARLPREGGEKEIVHSQYSEPGATDWWRYRIVRCAACGHRYADPVFNPAKVDQSYLDQEHDNEFGLDPALLTRTYMGYADVVTPFLPTAKHLQVDIGCDTGCFLRATRKFGFNRAVGVEPGKVAADEARRVPGVEIRQKLFAPADFENGSIQLASLIHVLDHLSEPRAFLCSLRELLAGDGIVLVVVHNIESLIARGSGANWSPLGVIHFDYFTPATLRRILESAGFQVQCIRRTTNYFPLYHLIRFAPGLPAGMRRVLHAWASRRTWRNLVFGLKLGNIAAVATAG